MSFNTPGDDLKPPKGMDSKPKPPATDEESGTSVLSGAAESLKDAGAKAYDAVAGAATSAAESVGLMQHTEKPASAKAAEAARDTKDSAKEAFNQAFAAAKEESKEASEKASATATDASHAVSEKLRAAADAFE